MSALTYHHHHHHLFSSRCNNHTACQYVSRTDKAIMLLQLPYRNKKQIKTNDILWTW